MFSLDLLIKMKGPSFSPWAMVTSSIKFPTWIKRRELVAIGTFEISHNRNIPFPQGRTHTWFTTMEGLPENKESISTFPSGVMIPKEEPPWRIFTGKPFISTRFFSQETHTYISANRKIIFLINTRSYFLKYPPVLREPLYSINSFSCNDFK